MSSNALSTPQTAPRTEQPTWREISAMIDRLAHLRDVPRSRLLSAIRSRHNVRRIRDVRGLTLWAQLRGELLRAAIEAEGLTVDAVLSDLREKERTSERTSVAR